MFDANLSLRRAVFTPGFFVFLLNLQPLICPFLERQVPVIEPITDGSILPACLSFQDINNFVRRDLRGCGKWC